MQPIRLVIVERRTLFRQGLAALLRAEADFLVVGEAASAEEARHVCQRVLPELILLSAALPEDVTEGRLAVVSTLRAYCPAAILCVLGRAGDTIAETYAQTEQETARRRGAEIYLSPTVDQRELLRVLRAAVAERQAVETVAQKKSRRILAASDTEFPHVTERERAILALITEGLSNKEIAHRMGIQLQTVKNHVSHLLTKLGLEDRTQLAVYTLEHHLAPPPEL